MPNLVNFEKSSRSLPMCQTELDCFTFSGLSIIFGPRGHLWIPQTWSSVKPLDHNKRYKCVPLQSVFTVHRTQQYVICICVCNLTDQKHRLSFMDTRCSLLCKMQGSWLQTLRRKKAYFACTCILLGHLLKSGQLSN